MGKNVQWTPQDVEKLLAIYSETQDARLIEIFGRTISAIEQKARRIGIEVRQGVGRGNGRMSPWTQQDDDMLKRMVSENKRSADIASVLGRTVKSIDKRVALLGLVGRHGKSVRLPVGSERLVIGGMPERKVSCAGSKRENWKRVDVIEWEAVNGPLPEGMVLIKAHGKPRTVENLQAVPRCDVPMYATYDSMTPEIRRLVDMKRRFSVVLQQIEQSNPDGLSEGKWTEDDISYLRENYASMSWQEIADALRKEKGSVVYQLRALGLRRYSRNDWTRQETEKFAALYQSSTTEELSEIFGRTTSNIYKKASALGLSRGKRSAECRE